MSLAVLVAAEKSRLRALLDHFAVIEDPREPWRVAHPLPEVLLLAVCGTIADCDDYEGIAAWGKAHLAFLRGFLPYHHGVPGARWLTILMNRVDPDLFSAAFTAWVRQTWPDRLDLVAIDGKTSVEATTAASTRRRFTWSLPSRRPAVLFSVRKRLPRRPTRPPPLLS